MKNKIVVLIFLGLLCFGCASKSFVRKEIQKVEERIVKLEKKSIAVDSNLAQLFDETLQAMSLASRALWKDKVVIAEFIPYLAEREINFAFDSYRLNKKAEIILDEIGQMLRLNPEYKLTIKGHTDSIASDIYNQDLGRRRAEEVKRYLAEKFSIPLHQIFSLTLGESMPKTSNVTKAGRAANRRVVLQIWEPM